MKRLAALSKHALWLAYLLEIICLVGMYCTYVAIYLQRDTTIAPWEFAITYSCLFLGGVVAGALSIMTIYFSVLQTKHWITATIKVVLAFISLLIAGIFSYALLIFLAVI